MSALPEWVPRDSGGWVEVALQGGQVGWGAARPHAAGGDRMEGALWGSETPYIRAGRMGAFPKTPRGHPRAERRPRDLKCTSSFIFINTCKFQEPLSTQGRGAESVILLEASFPRRRGGVVANAGGDIPKP